MNEDVGRKVAVVSDEVRGSRLEGHETAIGADRRGAAEAVRLAAGAVDTCAPGRAGQPVADEHVSRSVGVAGDEVGGVGVERHEAAIAADRHIRVVAAELGRLGFGTVDVHPLGHPEKPIPHKDIVGSIGVAGRQVRGRGEEGNETSVAADRRHIAETVALDFAAVQADPLGRPVLPIVHEDIRHAVGIVQDQIRGAGPECNEAAVGRDGFPAAETGIISLDASASDANPLDRAGCPIPHENIVSSVRIVLDDVGGPRREGHKATVGADRCCPGSNPGARAIDVDLLGRMALTIVEINVVSTAFREERDEAAIAADRPGRALAVEPLIPIAVQAHSLDGVGMPVAYKHVVGLIGVAGDEVVRICVKRHEPAVGADCHARATRLNAGGPTDPLGRIGARRLAHEPDACCERSKSQPATTLPPNLYAAQAPRSRCGGVPRQRIAET